jgi:hypothetical protein
VLKVNRSEPRKAKVHQQFPMPPSDPSRFSLVTVHAQNPAQLEPPASRRPDGRLVWRRASVRWWPQWVVLPLASRSEDP